MADAFAFQAVLASSSPVAGRPESPVVRTIALRDDQTLDELHEALRIAFGWADPHLYSFWLSGKFWDGEETEYTAPFEMEELGEAKKSALVPLGELGLRKGKSIAYLFDFATSGGSC